MNENNANVIQLAPNQARVNITYKGENGDLPDAIFFDATDGDIKTWVTEAVRTGSVPGIPADVTADFADFVVDRFAANAERDYALVQIRPKTPFGSEDKPDSLLRIQDANGKDLVSIDLRTGKVTLDDPDKVDAAAELFWRGIKSVLLSCAESHGSSLVFGNDLILRSGRSLQGLAGNIIVKPGNGSEDTESVGGNVNIFAISK